MSVPMKWMIKYNEEIKITHDETDETECNEDMSL